MLLSRTLLLSDSIFDGIGISVNVEVSIWSVEVEDIFTNGESISSNPVLTILELLKIQTIQTVYGAHFFM